MIILVVDNKQWSQHRLACGIQRWSREKRISVVDQVEYGMLWKQFPELVRSSFVCEMPWYEASMRIAVECERSSTLIGSHGLEHYETDLDNSDWRTRITTKNRNRFVAETRLPLFDSVLCISKRLRKIVDKFQCIPYLTYPGVDHALFRPWEGEKARGKFTDIVIGWQGQKRAETKGYDEVWVPVRGEVADGKKGFRENTRNPTEALSAEDMRKWYCDLNVLVSTSFSEGFQTTVLEAMACGVPCIVTDCNGAAEAIEHGQNGWIVDSYHEAKGAHQTKNMIVDLLNTLTAEDYRQAGILARRTVEDNWTWLSRAPEWIKAIEGR